MNNIPSYNFIIIGKSGAGKSSLINHFFNKELAKVGQGKPVTAKEFEKFSLKEPNLEINIFDSWGIEGGKTDEWLKYFIEFSNNRKDENISEWIHTAVYCVSGESKRLEDFEKQIINQLITEKLNPIIAITKSDLDLGNNFFKSITKEYPKLSVVNICNVEKQVGLGSKKIASKKFGIENLKESIKNSSLNSFEKRFLYITQEISLKAKKKAIHFLEKEVDGILNNYKTNLIGNISESNIQKIENEIISKVQSYNQNIYNKVSDMYNQAADIYGEFFKNKLSLSEKKIESKFRLKENESFIERFLNTITFGKTNNRKVANYLISSLPLKLVFPGLLFFDSAKIIMSIKGVDKDDLKDSIMNELRKLYE